ncbi:flagellar hook-basal body complex protein [Psychromonas aquimarina]|uniref:flagellar hook-basal body complex protein n=1 Tax=Psychromonas aquimarina TaxID=444919 RepID=UPI0004258309|nr:flagellar hook-basal body complex protein [Psychromonas aquimarina]
MKLCKYLCFIAPLIITGCGSDSDNNTPVTSSAGTTNVAVTSSEASADNNTTVTPPPIDSIKLQTAVDNDFFVLVDVDTLRENIYFSNSNEFYFNSEGYLVNVSNLALQVFPVNEDGSPASVSLSTSEPIQLEYNYGSPVATTSVGIGANLPANDTVLAVDAFDAANPTTFNNATSVTIYDSLGQNHILSMYFMKTSSDNNTWEIRTTIDGNLMDPVSTQVLDFAENGDLDITDDDLDGIVSTDDGIISYHNFPLSNGATDLLISLYFKSDGVTSITSTNASFEVSSLEGSGAYSDYVKELKIGANGLVTLSFVDQEDVLVGIVAMAKFQSPVNLESAGDSLWKETAASGEARLGYAGYRAFGSMVPVNYDY